MEVLVIYKEANAINEIVSIEEAESKLEGYWKKDDIRRMIVEGERLFTPYADFYLNDEKDEG